MGVNVFEFTFVIPDSDLMSTMEQLEDLSFFLTKMWQSVDFFVIDYKSITGGHIGLCYRGRDIIIVSIKSLE